ncbi:homoserine O-succinyltransferase [Acidaminococcus fermentans]|uniref:Homoserine O-acetyltransferase n=1 Tax=Acidaminococcus fermentans TaxID=905 RepID=A0A6N7VX86_ACIFE|nr:homoserine O-succinyltransferase [Acidaminococcus fermentans]MSS81711.1 homoserine O-succinyltransferase [Acidaminococcus fermentans]
MPIKIDSHLSAKEKLREENIITIDNERALTQDIRPLKILILNLMPLKKPTEVQLLRLLGNSPLQLEIDFCRPVSRVGTHTDNSYLESAYLEFRDVQDRYYDGLIVTGAPVEKLEFEDVEYWGEIEEYLEWARTHVYSVLHYCWGAQAGLYYYYDVPKIMFPQKLCGIYPYGLTVRNHPLLRGFDDRYFIPQSRYTTVDDAKVYSNPDLQVLSRSVENGINICATEDMRRIFVMGHFEYDRMTLRDEYVRDREKGLNPSLPKHYYPTDDTTQEPLFKWCSYAHLFYLNWLNVVYQDTPYDLHKLTKRE